MYLLTEKGRQQLGAAMAEELMKETKKNIVDFKLVDSGKMFEGWKIIEAKDGARLVNETKQAAFHELGTGIYWKPDSNVKGPSGTGMPIKSTDKDFLAWKLKDKDVGKWKRSVGGFTVKGKGTKEGKAGDWVRAKEVKGVPASAPLRKSIIAFKYKI